MIELQPAIDLVGEQPDAMLAAQADQRVEGRAVDHLAGRIVREVDGDELGIGADFDRELIEIEVPVAIRAQCHALGRAQRQRDLFRRLVVGRHDDRMVVLGQQSMHRAIDAFFRAREGEHVVGLDALVGRRDGGAQLRRAPGLDVAERQLFPLRAVGGVGEGQQLLDRESLRVRRRHVPARGELPLAEIDFEVEIGELGHWAAFMLELRAALSKA